MLEPGVVLADKYRIVGILGQGGMGGVYEATQMALQKPFALKEMLVEIPKPALREAAVRQFRLEAQILHSLEHPGLPRLYDFFDVDGRYYLVMELVRGSTLDQVVADKQLTEAQLLRWLHEICAVLKYIHTHDPPVTFRDLKPSNIMLTQDGHIKLIDFGIAKVWDAPDEETLTRTGVRGMCTPGFAAPEQYGGGTDHRTDIYALGATAYSLLTRSVPPSSVDLVSGRAQLPSLRSLRPDVSQPTAERIEWMMKPNVAQRPQSIDDVMGAFGFNQLMSPLDASPQTESRFWLGPALTHLSPGADARTTQKKKMKPTRVPRRHDSLALAPVASWVPLVGGAVAAALLAALIGWNMSGRSAPPKAAGSEPVAAPVLVVVAATPQETKLFDGGAFVAKIGGGEPESMKVGHHVLTFEHLGFHTVTENVDIRDGGVFRDGQKIKAIQVSLVPLKGRVHVTGTARAKVTIDGEVVGPLPLKSEPVLNEGTHTVMVSLPGYQPWSNNNVVVKADRVTEVPVSLQAVPAPAQPVYRSSVHDVSSHAQVHHGLRGFVSRLFH